MGQLAAVSAPERFNTAMTTVLVVDDEPIVREVVVTYLRREGFQTLERLGAVAQQRDLKPFASQVLREHLAELAVVVDDQQGGWQGHGRKVRFFRWFGR